MAAHVPTWAELRLHADDLAKLQRSCYDSVHRLLHSLPELDKRIKLLNGKRNGKWNVRDIHKIVPIEKEPEFMRQSLSQPHPTPMQEPLRQTQLTQQTAWQHPSMQQPSMRQPASLSPLHPTQMHQPLRQRQPTQPTSWQQPSIQQSSMQQPSMRQPPSPSLSPPHRTPMEQRLRHKQPTKLTIWPQPPIQPTSWQQSSMQQPSMQHSPSPSISPPHPTPMQQPSRQKQTTQPKVWQQPPIGATFRPHMRTNYKSKVVEPHSHENFHVHASGPPSIPRQPSNISSIPNNELDFDRLEHLRPLPMPLSEYFKINRPSLARKVSERVMYLRRKTERRKKRKEELASTREHRIISSLERIRLSSRNGRFNNHNNHQQHRHTHVVPEYRVKVKLSEQEMRKLTAKNYKRLPEVKQKNREEVIKYMKVQNYKNKQEFGRKLIENRRQGIINYPLKSSYDDLGDRSISSSQSNFSLNGYGRAADTLRVDPEF